MKFCTLKFIILVLLFIEHNRWYCFCNENQFLSSQDDIKSEAPSRIKISEIDSAHHSSAAKQEADVIQTTTNERTKDFTASKEPIVANTASQQMETIPISSAEGTILKPSVQVETKANKNYQSTSQQKEDSVPTSEETKKPDSKLKEVKVERKENTADDSAEVVHKVPSDSVPEVVSKDQDRVLAEKVSNTAEANAEASVQEKAVQTETGTKSETAQTTHSEVMPSFDEWKKMMLAEQEKDGHKVQAPSSVTGKKIAGHKRRHNYASYECGAKVVASNSEAEGTNHILNEMVDQYMLNPCKAKIWFVIELCESIQASQIELANFELFSSSPKEFSISWSDRFPTREWTPLGVVIVEDQRALQSFNLQHQGYGKFIKLELLSHYGTEHYCPLSVVRVFGTSMVDEYEEMETADTHHLPEDDDDRLDIPSTEEAGSSQDIFGSARDAVINIVKKAAQVLSRDHQQDATEGSRLGELLDTQSSFQAECERYLNCTDASNLTVKEKITLPITSSFIPYLEYCDSCSLQVDNYQTHTGSASTCHFLFAALGPLVWESLCEQYKFLYDESSSRKVAASSDVPTTHSTILPDSSTKSMSSSIDKSEKLDTSHSKLSVTTSKSSYSPAQSEEPLSSASTFSSPETLDLQKSIQPTKTLQYVSDEEKSKLSAEGTETFSERIEDSVSTEKTKQNGAPPLTMVDREAVSASETVDHMSKAEKTKKTVLDESSIESTETPIIQESHAVKPEIQESTVSAVQPSQQSSSIVSPSLQDTEITKDEIERFEKEEKYENGDQSSILTKVEPVLVGTPSTPPGQKESVFMRMGNRIKALELNMSLSSQYLQELSQRYRRQMEDMQKAFNRTIGTLNDTARKAAVRDLHQREAIDQLQAQVANLTEAVDLLLHERQSAHKQMLETHLCLMVIEAIIMTTILSLCVRRMGTITLQQKSVVSTDSSQSQPFQSYTEYSMGGSSSPTRSRKRSANDSQFPAIQANYQVVEPLTPVVAEPPPKVKKKHHRNKKKNQQAKFNHQISDLCSKNCFSSLLDCDINSGQPSEKVSSLESGTSVQSIKKTVNCENSHYVQKLTDRDRTKAVPLQNLTNGPVHVNSTNAVQADKFNLKKFLKMQKKHSF